MLRCVINAVRSLAMIGLVLALAGCAGGSVASGDLSKLTGDENGGRIADAMGPGQSQSMNLVTSYCARHDKKGFITKMDYDNNTITFECRKMARSG
jgi:hypothetical protein